MTTSFIPIALTRLPKIEPYEASRSCSRKRGAVSQGEGFSHLSRQPASGRILLPVHDKQGRVMKDENGDMVFQDVVMLPNRQALETRLHWKAPDRFPGNGAKRPAPPAELPPPSVEYARPRDLQDMLIDVLGRLKARGIKFKPSIETTAKKGEESTPEPLGRG